MAVLREYMLKTCCVLGIICLSIHDGWCVVEPGAEAIVVDSSNVIEGNSIMLSCAVYNVSGESAKSFRMEWRREGVVLTRGRRVISPDPRYSVTMIDGVSDRRDFVLHIDRVNRSDAGRYICWVIVRDWYPDIPDKRATSHVDLTVKYFPPHPVCRHSGKSLTFSPGADVELACSVREGEPTVRTRWKGPDDMVIFAHETHHDGYVSNILAFQVLQEHNGMTFTCKVTSDAFLGISSTCRVGPIQVIEGTDFYVDDNSAGSFVESSIQIYDEPYSELAPLPRTTKQYPIHTTDITPSREIESSPGIGNFERNNPIKQNNIVKSHTLLLSIFIVLFAISTSLNVYLYAKLRKQRTFKVERCEDEDNNIVPSIASGISNEEYMDMREQRHVSLDAQFYATISGDTSTSQDVDYDHPRVSVAKDLSVSIRTPATSNYRNSIYENLGGRPITPPRSKRKTVLMMQEHVV